MNMVCRMNIRQHGPLGGPQRMNEAAALVELALPFRRRHYRIIVPQDLIAPAHEVQMLIRLVHDNAGPLRPGRPLQAESPLRPGLRLARKHKPEPRRTARLNLCRQRGPAPLNQSKLSIPGPYHNPVQRHRNRRIHPIIPPCLNCNLPQPLRTINRPHKAKYKENTKDYRSEPVHYAPFTKSSCSIITKPEPES